MSTRQPGAGDERDRNRPDGAAEPAKPAERESGSPESVPPQPDPAFGGVLSEVEYPAEVAPVPPRTFATPPRPGSIQRQQPGVTQPRPPTVAEARARDKARKQAEEQQRAAAAAEQAKRRTRKRVMIGGVAIVGVAALVGGGYLTYRALTAPDKVTAYCVKTVDGQEVVVDDSNCGEGRPGFIGGPGVIFLGGGPQYRYYYGGTNTVGKPPIGGTTVQPKGAEIKTKSGTTIQRGGLGSKSTGSGGS
ncbi:hypothetical protein [Nocardia sp. NPDC052566]|uniref:hypothetical protein n=1 Tax=Nocardia sp. NPDC052566 TaxID=3364330 RepID=UPI0037CA99C7